MLSFEPGKTQERVQGDKRIDDIEILRAIAVLFVIFEHLRNNLFSWPDRRLEELAAHFRFGTGVNIFFVISGFVIARSILPKLLAVRSNRAFEDTTLSFWVRRAWRLLPSAWLWLVIIQLASLAWNESGAFGPPRNNFAALSAGVLNVANVRFNRTFPTSDYGASFPYWSLSLEEQFYILFPIVVFIFRRLLPWILVPAMVLQWLLPQMPDLLPWAYRSDGLILGVLIAIWSNQDSYRLVELRWLQRNVVRIPVVAGLLVALAAASARQGDPYSFRPALITLIGGALVLLASFDRGYIMRPGVLKRAMMWIGSRSYALYLVHIPAFSLTREFWYRVEPTGTSFDGRFALRFVLLAIVLLGVLAEANYRLVEMPLRAKGARIAGRMFQPETGNGSSGRNVRRRPLWPAILAGWVCLVAIGEAGKTGRFDQMFLRPVSAGQDIAAYPTLERVAVDGWSRHEPWGVWSLGRKAELDIPITGIAEGSRLFVKGWLLLAPGHPTATVVFMANGIEIGRLERTVPDSAVEAALPLPVGMFAQSPDRLRIEIIVDGPVSPKALGLSDDPRELGFALMSMKLVEGAAIRERPAAIDAPHG